MDLYPLPLQIMDYTNNYFNKNLENVYIYTIYVRKT